MRRFAPRLSPVLTIKGVCVTTALPHLAMPTRLWPGYISRSCRSRILSLAGGGSVSKILLDSSPALVPRPANGAYYLGNASTMYFALCEALSSRRPAYHLLALLGY